MSTLICSFNYKLVDVVLQNCSEGGIVAILIKRNWNRAIYIQVSVCVCDRKREIVA